MSGEGVLFKAYLQNDANSTKEIRRFKTVVNNYFSLREKLITLFDDLNQQVDFSIYWKDTEGDSIKISTDEELLLALNEQNCDVYKIYIVIPRVIEQMQQQRSNSSTAINEILHLDVTCDGCKQPVRGFRYKCLQCDDYDLCCNCEGRRIHSQHLLLRIPLPANIPLLRCLRGLRRRCRRSGVNDILTEIFTRAQEGVHFGSEETQNLSREESSDLLHGVAGVCVGVAKDVVQLAKYLETFVASNSGSNANDTGAPVDEPNITPDQSNQQSAGETSANTTQNGGESDTAHGRNAVFVEQLSQLYAMGFEDTNGCLTELLQKYDGNMVSTLNHLLNQFG